VKRRAAVLLGVPVLLAIVAAVPLGLWRGPYQWLCAAVALAVVVPPGLVTLLLVERMSRGSPYGQVGALVLGTCVRLLVGFGGAAAIFLLARPTFQADAISFWIWLLGVYLTTLIVETVLLSDASKMRPGPHDSV
jgi:hypothetical protein